MKDVRRLLSYLKPYWHFQVLFILSSLGYSGSNLFLPWIEKWLIDDVFLAENAGMLLPTCGLWILTAVGMYFFALGVVHFPSRVAENGSKDIQLDAYHRLRKLGFRFYDSQQTGYVMAIFTSDTPKAVEGFGVFAGDYIINALLLTITMSIIIFISWQLCLFSLMLIGVNVLVPMSLSGTTKSNRF